MSVTFPIFLRKIVIDSTNKAISLREGGSTETVNIAEGSYYVGPLTSDGADLLAAIKTALDSHTNAVSPNTYTVAATWSSDPTATQATITISQSGGSTFQLRWADAATTFDPLIIGFPETNSAENTSAKSSTANPTGVWVSDQPHREIAYDFEQEATVTRTESGAMRSVQHGGPYVSLNIDFSFITADRAGGSAGEYVSLALQPTVNGSMAAFINRCVGGGEFLIYLVTISSGFTLNEPSGSEAVDTTTWVFSQETVESFRPRRLEPGLSLFEFSVRIHRKSALT